MRLALGRRRSPRDSVSSGPNPAVTTELREPSVETTAPPWRGALPDLLAVLAGAGLVGAAAVVGDRLIREGVNLDVDAPPLFASWVPHTGPGTVPAILLAVSVILRGPVLARRLRWRALLFAAYAASLVWTACLTLVDGWEHGVLDKLTNDQTYLHDVPRVSDIPAMLSGFSAHILDFQPGAWVTDVAGHPPGALLVFVWMQRIGLGAGAPTAALCVLVGSSACIAVAVTARSLGGEELARRVLPFGVLFPGAVWIGVSADGMFAGVLAWGVALLAVAATTSGVRRDLSGLVGGLLLGFSLYLSYGLIVAGLLPVVVVCTTRRARVALSGSIGIALVVLVFTASGFWWWQGFELLGIRYYQGIAAERPYSYFVWADLACLVLVLGPAVLAGLRRAAVSGRAFTAWALTLAAILAVLAADLSGMSKAEVERIWLPFAVWLVLPCALLPERSVKWWLLAQALLALLVNHLLRTRW